MKITTSYASNVRNLVVARNLLPTREPTPSQVSHVIKAKYLKLLGKPKTPQMKAALEKFRRQSLAQGVQEPANVAKVFGAVLSKSKVSPDDLQALFSEIARAVLASEEKPPSSHILLKVGLGSIPLLVGAFALFYFLKQENQETEYHQQDRKPFPSESSPPDRWDIKPSGNMKVRLDLDGDPRLGEILFIRQMHGMTIPREGGRELFSNDPEFFYSMIRTVGGYQFNILQLLERLRPSDIFVEGLTRDFTHDELVQDLQTRAPRDLEIIRTSLMGDLPVEHTTLHDSAFFVQGAARIYALRHREVTLHRVMTPEEGDQIDPFLKAINPLRVLLEGKGGNVPHLDPDRFMELQNRREEWAVREIRALLSDRDWLRTHPRKKAVLIYGGMHDFCRTFIRENFTPQITSVWWRIQFHSADPSLQEIERISNNTTPEACAR